MKTVLFVCTVWPEPTSSAAGRYILALASLLKSMGIQRIVFSCASQPSEHQQDLAELGYESEPIKLNCSSFNHFVSELKPDAVIFDRFMIEEQFSWRVEEAYPKALRILDLEDLQSLRKTRHEAVKSGLEWSIDYWLQADITRREIAAIFRSDLSFVISSYEHELLRSSLNIPERQLMYLPFTLSEAEVQSNYSQTSWIDRRDFVAIGNYRHAPNWDSVLELKRLWPSIRKACRGAELNIYGAYLPPKAMQLDCKQSGFRIRGRAEDALSVISNARVLLAPLRFGAGLKGKLLEAALCRTPSITTPIGAEGMQSASGWPGYVALSDQEFTKAAAECFNSGEIWREASEKCSEMLLAFDRSTHLGRLQNTLSQLNRDIYDHRAKSFIGSMLRMNMLRSQKYMSQWIEAKNKKSDG